MTDVNRIEKVKNSRPVKLLDVVIIVVTILIALAVALIPIFTKKSGSALVITADGVSKSYDLSDKTITVNGITVVVSGGAVSVSDSDCHDKVCVAMGKIDGVGESIVCLPNGVVITITGESDFDVSTGESV